VELSICIYIYIHNYVYMCIYIYSRCQAWRFFPGSSLYPWILRKSIFTYILYMYLCICAIQYMICIWYIHIYIYTVGVKRDGFFQAPPYTPEYSERVYLLISKVLEFVSFDNCGVLASVSTCMYVCIVIHVLISMNV
jgi:hypothetical protein